MAQLYRKLLCEKVTRISGTNFHIPMAALNFTYHKPSQTPEMNVLAQYLGTNYDKASSNLNELCGPSKGEHFTKITTEMRSGKQWVKLSLDKTKLIQTVLASSPLTEQYNSASGETIVVEFSSPNIAKPFHAGHLRSTIIGNFVANINEFLGNRVLRLNYLGDWGTQFGYLALGVQLRGLLPADIHNDPIKCLYEAYVYAYEAARNDPKMHQEAMNIFSRMEQGTADDLDKWQEYRNYTVQELEELYRRLGVAFTDYEWESQYGVNKIRNVLEMLERRNLLKDQPDGRKVVPLQHRTIPIVKSDGSGMYLLRDIAALLDRHNRFAFQKGFYVVENGQSDHFAALREIAQLMQLPYANGIVHIKFGRIHGMSTRRGKVVFLKDILHDAQQLVREKQVDSPNTKTNSFDDPEVCDILGTSAVIINDLKQRRMKDYDFDWAKVLRMEGDSGIKLQYTHCRLASLLQTQSSAEQASQIQCDGSSLMEPEALDLVCQLANFKPICYQAQETAEACILVAYLFRLCKSINLALKGLPVKQESDSKKREQRILLYSRAKLVLHTGLQLLGLRPLNEM